ncbi:MAG: hypothetical protein LBC47_04165 [Tannerella sp.]|jgi:hypothetical protein|nr:hypothetical protein [Tannerella sp.]
MFDFNSTQEIHTRNPEIHTRIDAPDDFDALEKAGIIPEERKEDVNVKVG